MTDLSLQEVHDLFIEIAHEAGRMMLAASPSTSNSSTKNNTADLVTLTDRAIESMVQTRLRTTYPTIPFIGEETYSPTTTPLTSAPTFIIDPIDGTTNFIHSFPYYCISLGLAVSKTPVVGVIYAPALDELYTAISGQGAYLISRGGPRTKLPLRQPPAPLSGGLASCIVGLEWGYERSGPNYELKMAVFRHISAALSEGGRMVQSIRSMGSAALHMANVAAGREDVYWEGGGWLWDICAGWCVVREAGGRVVGANEGVLDGEVGLEGRGWLVVRAVGEGDGDGRQMQDGVVREVWGCLGGGRLVYE